MARTRPALDTGAPKANREEMIMDRLAVASSNIAEIGYDPDTETLEVMFHHGGVYQYYNVPAFMYERLMQAGSVGIFFNSEIKGHYPETRV
jgi:hypothetical protein